MATQNICEVEGCSKPSRANGCCTIHYRRMKKFGSYDLPKRVTSYGWIKANSTHIGDECLEWPFARNPAGYGNLMVSGSYTNAHRVMCEIAHGLPQDGMQAAHSCNNKRCVNPNHLRWDTPSGNAADKIVAGTQHRGESTPNSILTEQDVINIRSDWPHMTCDQLSEKYGCHRNAAWKAATGRTWRHV